MKINRRKLITGAAASAAFISLPAEAGYRHGKVSGVTTFTQGFIGGGGYQMQMSFAKDGTRFIKSDVPYVGKWNPSTGRWFPICTSPGMDGTTAKWATISTDTHAIAVAPSDSTRVYAIWSTPNNQFFGFSQIPTPWFTVYRSDDGGITWLATSLTTFQANDSNNNSFARVSSPKMYVDPANPDIVYASNAMGIFFVSYNAGVTWRIPTTLLNAWPHATATGNVPANAGGGTISFSAIPAEVLTFNSNKFGLALYGYNAGGGGGPDGLGPLALGSNGQGYDTGTANSTQFSPQRIMPRDGNGSAQGVLTGDVIYFGAGGLVCIDDSNGTVANPGIGLGDPGAKGLASKNVFFTSLHPAFFTGAVWLTTDGNPEHASATTGGPSGLNNIKVSNDKALIGGGNVVYGNGNGPTVASQTCWRYVGANPPTGSGLSANTWTNIPLTTGDGSAFCTPDPTRAGFVACINNNFQGSIALSTHYGDVTDGISTPVFTSAAGQPGWITNGSDTAVAVSDGWFDPLNSGHLIWLSGIAVYDSVPVSSGTHAVAANNITAGVESLVVQKIVKAPAPNGRILVACQDRPNFSIPDAHTYPTAYNPGGGNILQAGDIIYADDDPTVVFGSADDKVWRSQSSGQDGTWVLIGSNGVNGYVAPSGGGAGADGSANLAAPNKLSCIHADVSPYSNLQVGIPTGDPNVGANWNWQNCLSGGNPISSSGIQNYNNNIKYLDTDGAGNTYWYDGGTFIYKSTDFGRTFSKNASTGGIGENYGSRMLCIRGKPGQLLMAPGNNFGNNATAPLQYSTDSGQTWNNVAGTSYIWGAAIGKAKPGGSGFPAVFISGQLTNLGEPGVFRCDDFDGAQTWIRLDGIRKATLQFSQWISGDPDLWGHVLVACGQSGYVDGTIS